MHELLNSNSGKKYDIFSFSKYLLLKPIMLSADTPQAKFSHTTLKSDGLAVTSSYEGGRSFVAAAIVLYLGGS